MTTDQPPTDAATVLLLRQTEDGVEVFLVRRHAKSAFMPNRYVYPGGKVDPFDCTEAAADRTEGLTSEQTRRQLGEDLEPRRAVGLFLAGIRETFEEAGLLLARRAGEGDFIDLATDDDLARTFRRHRIRLIEDEMALSELATHEDLVFPLERLAYMAHWITPTAEPKRYDTRFFLAIAPENQLPFHDRRETTDSMWIRPADAIARNRSGEFQLAPPTLCTLRRLTEFETTDAAFQWAVEQRPPAILPHLEQRDGRVWIFLPGDPEFPRDAEPYADLEPVQGDVTRLVAEDVGLWSVIEDD